MPAQLNIKESYYVTQWKFLKRYSVWSSHKAEPMWNAGVRFLQAEYLSSVRVKAPNELTAEVSQRRLIAVISRRGKSQGGRAR